MHSGLLPALMRLVKSLRCLRRSLVEIVLTLFDKDEIKKFIFGKLAVEEVVVVDEDVIAPSES